MSKELKKYAVMRVDFRDLEHWLNQISELYPTYHLYQVVPEHCYDGAVAVIIMELNQGFYDVKSKEIEDNENNL